MDIFSPWLPIIFLMLGLLFGSFINVVIYRLPLMIGVTDDTVQNNNVNLWWPPSHCPKCMNTIKPWDNIPVISWLLLKGRCRHCKVAIPASYPISEFTIGMIYYVLATCYQDSYSVWQIASFAALMTLLYAASVIDIKHLLLPDGLVFSVLWGGLLFSAMDLSPVALKDAVIGVVVSWFVLWCVMSCWEKLLNYEGLGYGDVKLYAAASAWLGWEYFPALLLISVVLGILFYLAIRVGMKFFSKEHHDKDHFYIPFGPSIALAMLIVLFGEVM